MDNYGVQKSGKNENFVNYTNNIKIKYKRFTGKNSIYNIIRFFPVFISNMTTLL